MPWVWLQVRSELAEKELILLSKEQELLEKDQTLLVMREEVRAGVPRPYAIIHIHASRGARGHVLAGH